MNDFECDFEDGDGGNKDDDDDDVVTQGVLFYEGRNHGFSIP